MALNHKSLFHGSNQVYTQLHVRLLDGNRVRVQVPEGDGTMSHEYDFEVAPAFVAAIKKALAEGGTPVIAAEPTSPIEERLDSVESRLQELEDSLGRVKDAL